MGFVVPLEVPILGDRDLCRSIFLDLIQLTELRDFVLFFIKCAIFQTFFLKSLEGKGINKVFAWNAVLLI